MQKNNISKYRMNVSGQQRQLQLFLKHLLVEFLKNSMSETQRRRANELKREVNMLSARDVLEYNNNEQKVSSQEDNNNKELTFGLINFIANFFQRNKEAQQSNQPISLNGFPIVVLMWTDLRFCHPFLRRDTKKLSPKRMFYLICSSDCCSLPIATAMHVTFLSWNLTEALTSSTFCLRGSECVTT